MIDTFTISADGRSITCRRCKQTSHNPNDVQYHYCAHCKMFHDDIWPPARQWWIDHPDQPNADFLYDIDKRTAKLLFAIEAALPFVQAQVGNKTCSSSGGPEALKLILKRYDWDNQRWNWVQ